MNTTYFVCNQHKRYTEAGYRWAYWQLQRSGVITLGQPVDVARVLGQHNYWHPRPEERSDWLCREVLPTVRTFLGTHGGHGIQFVDEEFLFEQWELGYEWREVKAANEKGDHPPGDRPTGTD